MSIGNGIDPQEGWHPARLIPVAGIRGQEEQERRATSALLAVIGAVPEFGHALLSGFGAPKGRISAYAEVQLKDGDGKVSIPDGAIVVERGRTRWRTLVEVKTSGAPLLSEQVSRYLDLARDHGFDAVVTISNQITARPTDSPIAVDKRKLRRVGLLHLSWWRQGSFVRETRRQVIDFYGEVVQNLKPWQAKPPKLPEAPPQVPESPDPEAPPFVAVDQRDAGEGRTPGEPPVDSSQTQPGLDT